MTALAVLFGEGDLLSADYTLLIVWAIFIVLIFLLNEILFKPINKVLDDRERLTVGAVNEAKSAIASYGKQLANYEEKIRVVRGENYKMLEGQRKDALAERSRKLVALKDSVSAEIEKHKVELNQFSLESQTKLDVEARAMADLIARNLLKRPVGGASR
jgi:F-type H+-transporting ATPase subunit b